jgi:predicted O-methyltransferase YrrM
MPIIARLTALYESRGIRIAAGLNPSHYHGFPHAAFTWFVKDGASLTEGLGIALQEIYFLECLFTRFHPKTIFAIGNSLGWSTLALALANPEARVLAIDAATDRLARDGIRFTNAIAVEEGLAVTVIEAHSPEDICRVCRDAGLPPVEFALIDGYHAVEQVVLDFRALRQVAAPGCVYLFHDVANFGLQPGIERIATESGLTWRPMAGTTSGMAIVYNPEATPGLAEDIAPFSASPEVLRVIEDAGWRHRHRHFARWRRSLEKRLGRPRPPVTLD